MFNIQSLANILLGFIGMKACIPAFPQLNSTKINNLFMYRYTNNKLSS